MTEIDTATIRAVCDDGGGFNYRQTARVLCDEVDRLRARLAEVEAERQAEQETWRPVMADYLDERDRHLQTMKRAVAAEARLAEVAALQDWPGAEAPWVRGYNTALRNARAVISGEGDHG